MFCPVRVIAMARPVPRRSRTLTKKLKGAIDHARLLCVNHEDTRECQVAWDQVEELSRAIHRETLREVEEARLLEPFTELETRIYDL